MVCITPILPLSQEKGRHKIQNLSRKESRSKVLQLRLATTVTQCQEELGAPPAFVPSTVRLHMKAV